MNYTYQHTRKGMNVCCVGMMLLTSVLMTGCSSSLPANPSAETASVDTQPVESPVMASTPEMISSGQSLPITAEVQVADQTIQLEVAKTPDQKAMGLMFRTALPDDRGMLFVFNPARPVSFWMKNVVIALDMVFLREGTVQAIAQNVPPCQTAPCPVYGPSEWIAIDQVIELRGGRAAELGLKPGDRLTITFRK